MARVLCEKVKAEIFLSSENERGLSKDKWIREEVDEVDMGGEVYGTL